MRYSYKITKATKEDSILLSSIIKNSFRDVAEKFLLTPENCPKHPSNYTQDWVVGDLDRGVKYYIFFENKTPSGCVAVEDAGSGLCYLERLSVLPDNRRRGIGKLLVDHIIRESRYRGANEISIGIIGEDRNLKSWYQKLGFVEGESKSFPHLPFTVTFLSLNLGHRSDS